MSVTLASVRYQAISRGPDKTIVINRENKMVKLYKKRGHFKTATRVAAYLTVRDYRRAIARADGVERATKGAE